MKTAVVLSYAFSILLPSPAIAGEIVLHDRTSCNGYETIFSAGGTTGCKKAEQGLLEPLYYGASTSRNIGRSCKFNLYTDVSCKNLAGTIASSGPSKSCLPIAKGVKSYKITCADPIAATLVRPHTQHLTVNKYFQPPGTFRGKPSGNNDISAGIDFCGSNIKTQPTGNPSAVGTKLAAAFFSRVVPEILQFTVSATDGGTQWRVTLEASKSNNYAALTAARRIGQASFASLMADTSAQLHSRPCDYYYYTMYSGNYAIGGINMSYVAP